MVLVISMINVISGANGTQSRIDYCLYNGDCYNGLCIANVCECQAGYITWKDSQVCSYRQYEQQTAFLLSFFVGGLDEDWFLLAKGNGGYIVGGVFKLSTGGGLGIRWLVDVIRVGLNSFEDGNGAPLKSWWANELSNEKLYFHGKLKTLVSNLEYFFIAFYHEYWLSSLIWLVEYIWIHRLWSVLLKTLNDSIKDVLCYDANIGHRISIETTQENE